jgi:membrane-bound lytic murein transglycosylase B-like protein
VAPTQTQNIVATAPTTPSITTPQNNPAATGQVNTPSVGQPNSVQPAPTAPQNQTTNLPPTTLAPTQPVAQADTKPAPTPTPAPTPEPKTVPNISGQGVRGDVLLAMIEQNRCWTWTSPSKSFDGPSVDEYQSVDIAPVRMSAALEANNYTSDPNYWTPALFISEEGQRCSKRYYRPITEGTYKFKIFSWNDYTRGNMQPLYGEPWIKRGFNSLSVVYTINITTDSIEVGPYLRVDIEEDRGHHAETSPIFVPQGQIAQPRLDSISLPSKFKRDQVVPFGSIQEWKNDSDIVRLMLIKGSKKDEAKLCTNAELSFVRRLQCTVWHIPADWKWGQELQTPKGYIVDDRSAYPNESGLLYWRTMN